MNFLKNIFNRSLSKNPGANTWSVGELETFKRNLKQAIWWTELLAETFDMEREQCGKVFRKTNPVIDEIPLYNMDSGYATWQSDDYSHDRYDRLLELAIAERPSTFEYDFTDLNEFGRVLCFQTGITTHDGAAIIGSELFLDESDVPPIDTWFYLKRNYLQSDYYSEQTLFCWIPKKFESVVQQGRDVEIFDSYCWLDENDATAYEYIRKC